MSVADADSASLTTTLTVLNGRESHVTAGTGVSSNDTGSVTIAGTLAEINAALAGLSYTGNLDFNGPDTLTVTTGDGTLRGTAAVSDHGQPRRTTRRWRQDAERQRQRGRGGLRAAWSATDVDSPSLTYAPALQALHGTVVVNANGSLHLHAEPGLQRHRLLHLHGHRRHGRSEHRAPSP